jgi:hypothetical protein
MFTLARWFGLAILSAVAACGLLVPTAGARGPVGVPARGISGARGVLQHTGPGHSTGLGSQVKTTKRDPWDRRQGEPWVRDDWWREGRRSWDHDRNDWWDRELRRERRALQADWQRPQLWRFGWDAYAWQLGNYAGSNMAPYSLTANPGSLTASASAPGGYGGAAYPCDSAEAQADLIRADSEAKLVRERLRQERYRFDQDKADDTRRLNHSGMRQSRNVTASEIYSAEPLNDLLDRLSALPEKDRSGLTEALDEGLLEQVNVAPVRGGTVGGLRNGGAIHWPAVLRRQQFGAIRGEFNQLARAAIRQAASGVRVDPALLKEMGRTAENLEVVLKKDLPGLPPSDYIEAKRFLRLLDEAIETLGRPDVANYFDRTYEARGRTVAQLVEYMTRRALRFAPATPGTEQAYYTLYQALRASAGVTAEVVRR